MQDNKQKARLASEIPLDRVIMLLRPQFDSGALQMPWSCFSSSANFAQMKNVATFTHQSSFADEKKQQRPTGFQRTSIQDNFQQSKTPSSKPMHWLHGRLAAPNQHQTNPYAVVKNSLKRSHESSGSLIQSNKAFITLRLHIHSGSPFNLIDGKESDACLRACVCACLGFPDLLLRENHPSN